jgi:hypothetical protein
LIQEFKPKAIKKLTNPGTFSIQNQNFIERSGQQDEKNLYPITITSRRRRAGSSLGSGLAAIARRKRSNQRHGLEFPAHGVFVFLPGGRGPNPKKRRRK